MLKIEWPTVIVLIITYNRPVEIRRTLKALAEHLKYQGELKFYLCDDGSPSGYLDQLVREFPDLKLGFSITSRRGWGVNVNTGIHRFKPMYCFMIEDDYVAKREIDLSQGVALLETVPTIGLVRYDGLAGHRLKLTLLGVETPAGHVEYLLIDPHSPDLNIYSNRPHLKHQRFHGNYGMYATELPLGATEEEFAHRIKDRREPGPFIASLATGIPSAFDHVGHSWQGTSEDTLMEEKHA